jgi:hypothetical protein
MLQLMEGAFAAFFDGRGVVALMCARGLYEGLATITDFEKELMPLIGADNLQSIFQFAKNKAHATKLPNLIAMTNDQGVTAKNILTMIDKLKTIRANIPEEYAFLSEIAHPNGIGTVGFFATMNNPEDVAYFSDSGPNVHADLQWIFVASYLLSNFEQVMNRIEAVLPGLTETGRGRSRRHRNRAARQVPVHRAQGHEDHLAARRNADPLDRNGPQPESRGGDEDGGARDHPFHHPALPQAFA